MFIYSSTQNSPVTLTVFQDFDETVDYTFKWGDPVRQNATVYYVGDRVVPAADKGIVLLCMTAGISALAEPTITTVKNSTITDGTVIWKVINDKLLLKYNETIVTSTWVASDNTIALSGSSHTNTSSTIFVSTIPTTLTKFTLTNTIVTSNSPARTYQRSIIVPVGQL